VLPTDGFATFPNNAVVAFPRVAVPSSALLAVVSTNEIVPVGAALALLEPCTAAVSEKMSVCPASVVCVMVGNFPVTVSGETDDVLVANPVVPTNTAS
jgi:hypothetical protein